MKQPEISVIMPVFNGERFLRDAIESILTQTYQDFEFIIINDGSTDASEDIILSYQDPRILYIKNETNIRLIKTLNRGLSLAKGNYIARMDCDDISLPTRFEKQKKIFEAFTGLDIVNVNAFYLSEDGKKYREQKSAMTLGFEAVKYLNVFQNFISHPGVMVKSGPLKHYKYLDDIQKEHIEDYDLWNRMLCSGSICYSIKECLIYYRATSSSINHTQKDVQIARMFPISDGILKGDRGFSFDPESLMTLLGRSGSIRLRELNKLNREIRGYYSAINENNYISPIAVYEMDAWRKQKLFFLALKSIAESKLRDKFSCIFFILLHFHWLANKEIFRFIRKTVYPKNFHRMPINTSMPTLMKTVVECNQLAST